MDEDLRDFEERIKTLEPSDRWRVLLLLEKIKKTRKFLESQLSFKSVKEEVEKFE